MKKKYPEYKKDLKKIKSQIIKDIQSVITRNHWENDELLLEDPITFFSSEDNELTHFIKTVSFLGVNIFEIYGEGSTENGVDYIYYKFISIENLINILEQLEKKQIKVIIDYYD